jgi:hypothetical protein
MIFFFALPTRHIWNNYRQGRTVQKHESREFIFTATTQRALALNSLPLGLDLGRSVFDVGLFPLRFGISLVVFAAVTTSKIFLGGDEVHGVDGLHLASAWDIQ